MAENNGKYYGRRVQNEEVKFEIVKHLATLGQSGKWEREVNLVSWNDLPPKVDIRAWSPDHQRMGKGITLSAEELVTIQAIELEQNLAQAQDTATFEAEVPTYEGYEM